MKCQYAHCCFNDQKKYNWRYCSSTRQTPSSHQSVSRDDIADMIATRDDIADIIATRDDIADIIAHLMLIASTHCMS